MGVAKFALGAWMVLVSIPILIAIMWSIRRHYLHVERALALPTAGLHLPSLGAPHVVVPVSRLDRSTLNALAYAKSIASDVVALHVVEGRDQAERMHDLWEASGIGVELVIVKSPSRSLLAPLLAYIDAANEHDPSHPISVVLAEFVPRHFWEWFLHNQTALRLKMRLFFRRNTVVIDVPYHLDEGSEVAARERAKR